MRNIVFIACGIVCWCLFSSFHSRDAIEVPVKKINKTIERLWKDKALQLEEIYLDSNSLLASGLLFEVKDQLTTLGFVYIGRVNSCRSGGCNIESEKLEFEYFDYFFVADSFGEIMKVKVFNYKATHGHEIMSSGWLRQFIGYNGQENLIYGKDIQAISGATISAVAINAHIQNEVKNLQRWLQL